LGQAYLWPQPWRAIAAKSVSAGILFTMARLSTANLCTASASSGAESATMPTTRIVLVLLVRSQTFPLGHSVSLSSLRRAGPQRAARPYGEARKQLSRSSVASGAQRQLDQSEVFNVPTRSDRHDSVANVALGPVCDMGRTVIALAASGQTHGPHHSNLISARPVNARWALSWHEAPLRECGCFR
jgi:hypothetical protein